MIDAATAPAIDPALLAKAKQLDQASAPPPPPQPGAAAAAAPGQPGAPVAPPIDWLSEARELWRIVAMLKLRYTSLEPVFTDAQIERLAVVYAPILQRHNWDLGYFMIYIVAGAATLPVAGDAYVAIKHDRAIEKVAKERAAAAPKPAVPAAAAAPSPGLVVAAAGGPDAPPDANRLHERA